MPDGGRFESATLVEQTHVQVQDALADDVESKVPGLDDAGMNRADRNLVSVAADGRHRPLGKRRVMVEQRPHRLVPVEVQLVQVVGFALVPGHCRDRIHECLDAAVADLAEDQAALGG